MNRACIVCFLPALLVSCYTFEPKGQVGFARMQLSGDIGLEDATNQISTQQDLDTALGLGDAAGSPYARLELDFGVPVLAVSAFQFSEDGRGTLSGTFGNIPASAQVDSEMDFTNLKVSYTFDIDFGVVKVSPGLAMDLFDLQTRVREVNTGISEEVDVLAPVPLVFVRGMVDLEAVALVAEGGILEVDVADLDGRFVDVEAWLEVRPLDNLFLFAGYRWIIIDADGESDSQRFRADLELSGWQVGGGFRF